MRGNDVAGSLLVADDDVGERAATLGDEIVRLRDRAGLTQQQLADLTGLSRGYIGQLETGDRSVIGGPAVYALADALGVSSDHWRPYLAPEPPPPPSRGKLK